jgi:M6 family metalloprotease-like protein
MNRKIISLLIFLLAVFGSNNIAMAVPAAPDLFDIAQPDGIVFKARLAGDEWNNWLETYKGYTVDKGGDGFWYYISRFDNDKPVLSRIRAHEIPQIVLGKHLRPDKDFIRAPASGKEGASEGGIAASPLPSDPFISFLPAPSGPFSGKILFILAEFTDRAGTYTEASFAAFINNNINDYYNKASYGNVTLSPANESFGTVNNGVVGWLNLGYAHPNTGSSTNDNNRTLTRNAIIAADPYVNFSVYDTNSDGYVDSDELAVVVIAAGYERSYSSVYTPNVWGHAWSLGWGAVSSPIVDGVRVGDYHSDAGGYAQFGEIHRSSASNTHQATMGIMVHELGHLIFGFPDLYDTDSSSAGAGIFSIMASGSWGRAATDTYSGTTPVLPDAWLKYDIGWANPSVGSGITSITAAGSASATGSNVSYKQQTPLSYEYFLVENRRPEGYDRGLERWLGTGFGGLAIWHIDENTISSKISSNTVNNSECYPGGPSCATNHYGVALEQADGQWHLEKNTNSGDTADLWYLGNAVTFNSSSTPNSNLYNGSSSNVSITNISAAGSVMTATLTPPDISVSPASYDFGNIAIGNTSDNSFTVSNTAAGNLIMGTVTNPSSPFSKITDNCSGQTLATSSSCSVTIRFTPTTGGQSISNFNIPSNDPDENPVTVILSGTGYEMVRIMGNPAAYNTLQSAYDASVNGDTIQSQNAGFTEDLNINASKTVTLQGGYNNGYTAVTGKTTLNGNLMISNGTVTIENFTIQ